VSNLADFLFGHPFPRLVGRGLSGIVLPVLAGAYVFQITRTKPGGSQFIDWLYSPNSGSFWGLVVVGVLGVVYGLGVAWYEKKVKNALVEANKRLSNADLREKAYAVLLPAMLEYFKKELEAGRLTPMPEVMALIGLIEEDRK
jgi:hypothetical protein